MLFRSDASGEIIKSIVVGWHPEVDLYTYLIRRALVKRLNKLKELASDTSISEDIRAEYKEKYTSIARDVEETFREMYNAEIELVGIPADPPITAEIQVLPRILEAESRTSGIYAITGASDEINTSGVFTSKLKLFRLRSIDNTKALDINKLALESQKLREGVNQTVQTDTNVTTSTGDLSDGNRWTVVDFLLVEEEQVRLAAGGRWSADLDNN